MKKFFIIIICLMTCIPQMDAQTKSQVISDITYTMDDFASDLSFVNERPDFAVSNIQSISHTFGSADYFLYNGRQISSFQKWIEEYCFQGLRKEFVGHTFKIIQQTVEKVDKDEKGDKRYRFDAIMKRESSDVFNDENTVSFIVEWKGEGQYVSILEIKGKWYEQFQQTVKTSTTDNATQIKQKSDKDSDGFMTGLFSSPYLYIILYIIVIALLFYFVPEKGYVWIVASLFLLGGGIFIYSRLRIPDQIDKEILAQYDKYETVDSLKVAIVCKDGKWGLIDYRGEVLQKPICDSIGKFHDGMAKAHWSHEFFYINHKGESKEGSKFMYREATDYRNGMALVYTRNKEYHVIDKEGNAIRQLPYTKIHPFQDGYAKIEKDNFVGYIRQTDFQETIPAIYNASYSFSEGYAAVEKEGKWGIVDSHNNIKVPFKYSIIYLRGNRFITVDSKTNKAAMMDLEENIIIPFNYSLLGFMANDLILVKNYHKNYSQQGIMDLNGNWILQLLDNVTIYGFQEDMSRISKNRKYGFINKEGKFVLPIEYSWAWNYSNGLARVETGNKWGAVNKEGEWVIPAIYQNIRSYEGDLIAAKKDNKWGFINHKNEVVLPFKWDDAQSFGVKQVQTGTTEVKLNNLSGIIDKKGNYIIPCDNESLKWDNDLEIYVAGKNKKYGVFDKRGNLLHDFTNKEIRFNKNILISDGRILTLQENYVYREKL